MSSFYLAAVDIHFSCSKMPFYQLRRHVSSHKHNKYNLLNFGKTLNFVKRERIYLLSCLPHLSARPKVNAIKLDTTRKRVSV